MKPKIIKALLNVQSSIVSLGHDSENKFASYKYVSIDAYYRAIRPLLTASGLVIVPTETDASISPDGKTYKATFDFHIMHDSGEVWENAVTRTVYVQYTGAQSCGSALSYAEKFVMRTLFKIPTGEYEEPEAHEIEHISTHHDADATKPSKRGQDAKIDFDYSGAPYRVFNEDMSVKQSFTDIRPWGALIKTAVKAKPSIYDVNEFEISRIRKDVSDDESLTDKSRAALLASLDSIQKISGDAA